MPSSSRWIVEVAYRSVQVLAVFGAGAVVAVAWLSWRPFRAFLRAGGWPSIRGACRRAAVLTAVAVAATVGLVVWAHHLPAATRIQGRGLYGVAFVAWASTVAAAVAGWTATAVVTVRRLDLSPLDPRVATVLADVVTATMVAMTVGMLGWGVVVAEQAPGFLAGGVIVVGTVGLDAGRRLWRCLRAALARTGPAAQRWAEHRSPPAVWRRPCGEAPAATSTRSVPKPRTSPQAPT